MIIYSINGLEKAFGEDILFTDVSFELQNNDKTGLVGINGSGKTTLFKIIKGTEEYEKGSVSKISGLNIGYMEQQTISEEGVTVLEEALKVFSMLSEMETELDEINKKLDRSTGEETDALLHRQMDLREQYERKDGLTYKSRTMAALTGLGFLPFDLEKPVNVLSGGEKSKLQLAKLLLSDSGLMLLDEPTNHLDIKSTEWLEKFLQEYKGAFIVISHDRYFLDKVTGRTLEIENKYMIGYKGNYSEFLRKKEEAREARQKKYDLTVKEIKRIEGIIAQQKRFGQAHNYITIASKQKSIDRLEETLDKPENEPEALKFNFKCRDGSGNDVLIIRELSLTLGNRLLFKKASINIRRKERVFLLGSNGSGKTSLFKVITGTYIPDSGEVRFGARIETGYYDQTQTGLHDNKTVINELWDEFPKMTQTEIRSALGQFLFKNDDVFKEIKNLSGGEKARVSLLKLMLKGSNLLLLDEPTNHLDIKSREALEAALKDYPGTLFVISHDRYLINKLADRIYELDADNSEVREYVGNYDYYIERKERENHVVDSIANAEDEIVSEDSDEKVNLYQIKKKKESDERKLAGRIKRLETRIADLENEQEKINTFLASPEIASDYTQTLQLTEKLAEINVELETVMEEWDELV